MSRVDRKILVGMNILFFHQSAELYGSDKMLLSLVVGMKSAGANPIVLIPWEGLLQSELLSAGVECHVIPMMRATRTSMNFLGLSKLFSMTGKSMSAIDEAVGGRKVSWVHSNTLATLSGFIWARKNKVPHLWHVHEIVERPRIVKRVFKFLLEQFSTHIVFNSHAVKDSWERGGALSGSRVSVVYNGIEDSISIGCEEVKEFRRGIGVSQSEMLVVLVGRVNRWKGHKVLVESISDLRRRGMDRIKCLLVGDPPPGQEHYLNDISDQIERSRFSDAFIYMPFQRDIWPIWLASDVACVPSTEPEPFGLVAIEAMLAGKPVVAANHGGLKEIVTDKVTGLLVKPDDRNELSSALEFFYRNEGARNEYGQAGLLRAQKFFTQQSYISAFEAIYSRGE